MIHLPEDDKKIDLSEPLATTPSAQPFTSNDASSSHLPVNHLLNSQLEAAENGHLIVDVGNTPQNADALSLGPPPEFTQYKAEHFEVGYSDIVSHDPHLNSDGPSSSKITLRVKFHVIPQAKLSIAFSYLKLLLFLLIAFLVAAHTQKCDVDGSLGETITVNHDLARRHTQRPSQISISVSTSFLKVPLHPFSGPSRMMSLRTVVLWYASLKDQRAQEGRLLRHRT